jgi:hypothetical protein
VLFIDWRDSNVPGTYRASATRSTSELGQSLPVEPTVGPAMYAFAR